MLILGLSSQYKDHTAAALVRDGHIEAAIGILFHSFVDLIRRSPQMLRCSMCRAGWPLPLWLNHPGQDSLEPAGMNKMNVGHLRTMQFHGAVYVIP